MPTRRFYALVLLMGLALVSGLSTGFPLMFRLLYLFAFLAGTGALWAWWMGARLRVRALHWPTRAQAGESLRLVVEVENPTPLPRAEVEVRLRSTLPAPAPGAVLSLPRWGTAVLALSVSLTRRGVYTLGPLEVVGEDPLSLFRAARVVGEAHRLVVYPAPRELPGFTVDRPNLRGEEALRRQALSPSTDASTVRDYQQGDPLRHIHWPTTARTGRLMVKQFDTGQSAQVWLLLDLEARAHWGEGEESTLEHAVTAVASIARRYLLVGWPVGLVAVGRRRTWVPPERGPAYLDTLLEALAEVEADGTQPLARVLAQEGALLGALSTLVVVTPSLDPRWPGALEALRRQRVRGVVVWVDAPSFGAPGDGASLLATLRAGGHLVYRVRRGEPLEQALDLRQALQPAVGG